MRKEGTVVLLQARIGSRRLPNKVLMELAGKPIVQHAMESLALIPAESYLLVTDLKSKNSLEPLAKKCNFDLFIGPEDDVLRRFALALEAPIKAKRLVRATADNPLVSAKAAIKALELLESSNADYAALSHLPRGCGVEAVRVSALLLADQKATSRYDREHVCPYLYNHSDWFKIEIEEAPLRWQLPEISVSVDTFYDYLNLKKFYNKNYKGKPIEIDKLIHLLPEVPKYIFFPSVKKGNGMGHLIRCLSLAKDFRKKGEFSAFYSEDPTRLKEMIALTQFEMPRFFNPWEATWAQFLILDQREIEFIPDELKNLSLTTIAIDEGGNFKNFADYTIDTLPRIDPFLSNKEASPLLKNRRNKNIVKTIDLLITFGGEDPANLTRKILDLLSSQIKNKWVVAVVLGPNYKGDVKLDDKLIQYHQSPSNFEVLLEKSRIVLTSFGLTAYEAVSAKAKVLQLQPSEYHHQLAKLESFDSYLPEEIVNLIEKLNIDLEDKDKSSNFKQVDLFRLKNNSLQDIILGLNKPVVQDCPGCHSKDLKVLNRFTERTFFKCKVCHLIFQKDFIKRANSYTEEYFFEEYKNQYGKSYLEDFDVIYSLGLNRMKFIEKLSVSKSFDYQYNYAKTILDIGAAYGHFLKASRDCGWDGYGVDIAQSAVDYLNQNDFISLALDFESSLVNDADMNISQKLLELQANKSQKFNAVTMWYVIEHFSDLELILEGVKKLICNGSVFAFSTPNGRGISAWKNQINFFKKSPRDHHFILTPKVAKKLLKRNGFGKIKFRITGHHPERFGHYGSNKFLRFFVKLFSRIFLLGDTFECYAQYQGDLDAR